MNEQYTIHFEPRAEGGLLVTVPEIGVTVETAGDRLSDAQDAGLRAITEHLAATRKKRLRWRSSRQPKASRPSA